MTCRSSRSRSISLTRRFLTIAVIYLLLTTHLFTISHAIQASDLVVVTEHLPPYNYQDGTTVKGVATEVVQALLNEVGLQADIQVLSWVRAYLQALKKPNVLIFSIVRTPHREDLFHWVGQVSKTKSYLFKLAKRKDIQISSIEDAKSYLIGTWREDVREQYLLSQGFVRQKQVDSSGNPKQNIRKLMVQRLDLVADSELSFYYLVKQLNYHPHLFAKAFKLEAVSLPFYIAFSKQTSPDLVIAFRQALTRVKRKGIFHAIHQKYLGHAPPVPGTHP